MQALGFAGNVGAAFGQHHGLQAAQAQVVGVRDALADAQVGRDVVEGQTILEHIAEVQQQAARQGLQAQHAQQPGGARIDLEKLGVVYRQRQLAAQAGQVRRQRRAVPAQQSRDLSFAAFERETQAQSLQQRAAIVDVELEVERHAPR